MSQFTHLALIRQDARYTLRILRKQPAFAATAILTLALAIGGNTAMFAIIQAVLLKPLPYPHPDQLVSISGGATPTRLLEMQASARTLTAIGAYTGEETPTLSIASEPQVIKAARVSANFLQILQVNPLLGRSFRPDEDSPANPPVVMISAGLWQRAFSADPYILNRTATLGGAPYSIIGVLPPRFAFPSPGLDIWLTAPSEWPLMPAKSRVMSPFLTLFGRMKPDITLAQANAEAKVIQHQYAVAHPAMFDAKPKSPEQITPMKDGLVSNIRAMLYMLMGTVAFVLLIACANVAGLLLARATARSREIALRSALGAARLRLIGQFLIESVVLSLSGGLLGVLLAFWCIRGIPALHAFELPRAQEIHLDGLVLVFAAAVSILTGLLFGIAPALHASRTDLAQMLRMSGASAAGHQAPSSGPSMRGLLLVAQVSLSVVLLVGTALLLQSVSHLRGVSIGFNPANVLTASVSLPTARYDTIPKRALFWEQLLQRIRATPGVRSAAASMFLPMMGYAGSPVQDAAKPLLKLNERLIATLCVVTPRYFETLEIPMRRGRDFNERDKEESQRVAIIDETPARRFWPDYPHGLDPIGQHIWVGGINPRPAEIVGIVAALGAGVDRFRLGARSSLLRLRPGPGSRPARAPSQ